MIASKRERVIGLLTAGVLAVLALDRLVLTPLTERSRSLGEQLVAARGEQEIGRTLLENRGQMDQRWNEMLAGGIKSDVPEAESQALNALRDWMLDARVTITGLKPEREETQEHFRVVFVGASCTGSLQAITEFLWRVQTTELPMRVTYIQVSSLKPGTDNLSLQLRVSTLCLAPPPDPSKTPGGGRGARPGTSVASAAFGREAGR